jgi:hypothetical protein
MYEFGIKIYVWIFILTFIIHEYNFLAFTAGEFSI